MKKFIVATRNNGKLNEIKEILSEFDFDVVSMAEAGVDKDIDEYGSTFEENAMIKANEIFELTGQMVMADDSGLEVDYLNGAPGVHSARFAGENASDEDRNKKLISLLKDVPFEKRTARFVCAIAVVFPDGRKFCVRGACEGFIGIKAAGDKGFGYDPLFFIPEYKMTIAQMDSNEKNKISHRGNALRMMIEELRKQMAVD